MRNRVNLTQLWHQQQGIVLLETLLVVPVLVLAFAITLHFTSIYYVTNSLEKSVRVAARQLALGNYDEQTNGLFTPCSQISATTSTGKTSAEFMACDFVHFGFNSLQVRAYDGNTEGTTSTGTPVYVELQIPKSELLTIVPEAISFGPDFYQARVTMYGEASL